MWKPTDLKVGDEVVMRYATHYGVGSPPGRIEVVDRITPSGLIGIEERLFNKDGRERGCFRERWYSTGYILYELTPERRAAIEHYELLADWKGLNTLVAPQKLTTEELQALIAMMEGIRDRIQREEAENEPD